MKITKEREEGVAVLRLEGHLTIGEGDVELRRELRHLLDDRARKILLDLGKVRVMDSAGLGELVRCKVTSSRLGATVKLLHVEDRIHEILQMTRLIGVFDTFDDEIEAIASFRGE